MSKYKKLDKAVADVRLSESEINDLTHLVQQEYETYLKKYSIKLPKQNTAKFYWLLFLRKHLGVLVHKDTISDFVSNMNAKAGKDQQVRHLSYDGFYVLNKGEKIPNIKEKVPSGYHLLYSMEQVKPNFLHKELKRVGRVGAQDFESLKIVYDYRCATCGCEEGKPHRYFPDKLTVLEKGHKDPNGKAELSNIIPQCTQCNQYYKDYFSFDDCGRIKKAN